MIHSTEYIDKDRYNELVAQPDIDKGVKIMDAYIAICLLSGGQNSSAAKAFLQIKHSGVAHREEFLQIIEGCGRNCVARSQSGDCVVVTTDGFRVASEIAKQEMVFSRIDATFEDFRRTVTKRLGFLVDSIANDTGP